MIVVITITYNRLELSKRWLKELREKAGCKFYHIVVDNGSNDGTVQWLHDEFKPDLILSLNKNAGIIKAWLIGIKRALSLGAKFIVKFDNDCEIITDDILKKSVEWLNKGCLDFVVAPMDVVLKEEKYKHYMPRVLDERKERGLNVKYVSHTGGIFQVLPEKAAQMLVKCTDIDKIGGDLLRGHYWINRGISPIYLTDLEIRHRGVEKQSENYKLR